MEDQKEYLTYRRLYDVDRVRNGIRKLDERWQNRLILKSMNMAEVYASGNLHIIFKLERCTPIQVELRPVSENLVCTIFADGPNASVLIDNEKSRNEYVADHGNDDGVLVDVNRSVEKENGVPPPTFKSLNGFKNVLNGLAGCYYSVAGGYVIDPVLVNGEFEMLILSAVVNADQLPGEMVQCGSQVIESIAYYQGQSLGDFFAVNYAKDVAIRMLLSLNPENVLVFCGEDTRFPFKVSDVMIGPFNL